MKGILDKIKSDLFIVGLTTLISGAVLAGILGTIGMEGVANKIAPIIMTSGIVLLFISLINDWV